MSKTATVRARLEPDLKEHVEGVFHKLGLNPAQAITIFYRQVKLRGGLPFDVTVPTPAERHGQAPYARAMAAAGRFRSGRKDLSTRHDEAFAEASRP